MKVGLFIPCYIEGVITHGAQGARSLTVLLLAPAGEEAHGS